MADRAGIITAAPVTWSDGHPLDGYLLLGLSPPSGYNIVTKSAPNGSALAGIRIPLFVKIPIVAGKLDTATKVWMPSVLDPTGARYFAFWYSGTNTLLAADATPYDPEVDPFTITPLTLTAPSAASAPPTPDTPPSIPGPVFIPILSGAPTKEVPAGTINGVNAVFTISHKPTTFVVFKNGLVMTQGTAYTYDSNVTITFQSGYIPQTGDDLEALLWG